jgi:hypothetical protein
MKIYAAFTGLPDERAGSVAADASANSRLLLKRALDGRICKNQTEAYTDLFQEQLLNRIPDAQQ